MKKILAFLLVCLIFCLYTMGCADIPYDTDSSTPTSASEQISTTTTTTTRKTTTTTTTKATTTSTTTTTTTTVKITTTTQNNVEAMVWIPQSGKKYHSHAGCSNMKNPSQVSKSEAIGLGYEPCKRCY